MSEEWFVIPGTEVNLFRDWITKHPGYNFKKVDTAKECYVNSIYTLHNAKAGSVSCELTEANSELLVKFTFKSGGLDEGLLGMMRQTFKVLNSSFY